MFTTEREFLNAIIENVTDENIVTYATARLKKLDERNATRRSKAREIKPEDVELVKQITNILTTTDEPVTAKAISQQVNASPQKVNALVKKIENVAITKVITSNNRAVNAYKAIATE